MESLKLMKNNRKKYQEQTADMEEELKDLQGKLNRAIADKDYYWVRVFLDTMLKKANAISHHIELERVWEISFNAFNKELTGEESEKHEV